MNRAIFPLVCVFVVSLSGAARSDGSVSRAPGAVAPAGGTSAAPAALTPRTAPPTVAPGAVTPTVTPSSGGGASRATHLGPPAFSPTQLDFGEVWDGQSAMRTFSLTSAAPGTIKIEIPPGPFFVTEIRELSPPKPGGSKNNPSPQPQPIFVQETKGKGSFPEGVPSPWTYSAVAAGDQILVHLLFKPKFDISTMMAGPKSATMKVSGPGAIGSYSFSVPLAGMFDGKHTSPVLVLPQSEVVVPVTGQETAKMVVRLVAAGEEVTGKVVWSAASGIKPGAFSNVHLNPTETRDVTVSIDGTGGHGDGTALDGMIAFEFTRKGESISQRTPGRPFRLVFIPSYFGRDFAKANCNGVDLSRAHLTVEANGDADLYLWVGPQAGEVHYEVYFPEANRVLLHTTVPNSSVPQIVSRVEESGPTVLGTYHNDWYVDVEGPINPGPPDSLDRYRALLRSSAQLRCW
jgi:hypothetical protein